MDRRGEGLCLGVYISNNMIDDVQWSVNSLGIKIVFCADTYIHVHTLSVVSIQFCVAKCRLLSTI